MRPATRRLYSIITGLALVLSAAAPALADDSEVFSSSAYEAAHNVRPNILFIIDTSLSMREEEPTYSPAITYDGSCKADSLYWNTGSGVEKPPACDTKQLFAATLNRCKASLDPLKSNGVDSERMQSFDPSNKLWGNFDTSKADRKVECRADDGKHGDTDASAAKHAADTTGGWDLTNTIVWSNKQQYTLYTGNYVNWYYGDQSSLKLPRIDIVKNAARNLADTLEGVNLGLMRYDASGDAGEEGGFITVPVAPLDDTQRTAIKNSLDTYTPQSFTPLSETLYEAALYFTGGAPLYGKDQSVATSIEGGAYKSPMQFSCQKNFIVYLTDGLPTRDQSANSRIPAFDPPGDSSEADPQNPATKLKNDFKSVMGGRTACTANKNPGTATDEDGKCLDDLAEYMNKADFSGTFTGVQNVSTFFIGFGSDVQNGADYLNNAAKVAGTEQAYTAANPSALALTLQNIFHQLGDDSNLTFTSPTVSVNAFNRAQNLNDLYVSVFSPSDHLHWDGNLKKYNLVNSQIYGVDPANSANTVPAVDPATGFFYKTAKSFWSTQTDGFDVTLGGAANLLPNYGETATDRKLYTYLGSSSDLTATSNAIVSTNGSLTDTILGITAADVVNKDTVVAFARGKDLTDLNGNSTTDENNHQMGDPMHARPAVVIYGGTKASKDVNDALAFVPTNDGYLHAIDTKTGIEKWAFVPQEMLPRLKARYENPMLSPDRTYGLDGDVRVFRYDVDRDGVIDYNAGDRVYLYFGFGRGGRTYYALDVSQHSATGKDTPTFMWKKTDSDLKGLGDAWSTPAITKVVVNGSTTQSDSHYVLIFGGGYNPDGQESYKYAKDNVGNHVFMLDALTGEKLWSAGPGDSTTDDLKLTKMNNSIPGNITVVDFDGDGIADRMYAGDMGGRVWRFDIFSGSAADSLVTGGVFASLGAGDAGTVTDEIARRFYYAPDVALISTRGARPFYNLAIGSGYRGHPLDKKIQDRFYSLRDYQPFTKMSKDDYTALSPILDSDEKLVDATDTVSPAVPEGAPGWKLQLKTSASDWVGEKVLAEAITVGGVILFPTFQPDTTESAENPCLPRTLNRVYAVYADNARPFTDNNHDGDVKDLADRSQALKQGGIAAEISVIVNNHPMVDTTKTCTRGQANCICDANATECHPLATCKKGEPSCVCNTDATECHADPNPSATCLSGVEVLNSCVPLGGTVRTFWQRK